MAVDPYAPCPGGTGKKIKFCCPDLVTELEKIHHMLDSDQRAACLEYIEKAEVKTPNRACLMSVKAMLQAQLGSGERAEATLAAFREQYPDNPVALAEEALFKVDKQDVRGAIESLQRALAACKDQLPAQVYDALTSVAHGLLASGQILAARGHLMLLIGISGERDERTLSLLVQLNGSPSVPLLFKQDAQLVPAPQDAIWKPAFESALELAFRGNWTSAAERFRELAQKVGDQPPIWRNLAILRSWLAHTPGTIEALRMLAAQPIPLEDAVEAEALAQLIDPDTFADRIDVLTVPYPVDDLDKLQEALASSDQSVRMPVDLSQMGGPDEPPPRGAFWLLDRPSLASGVGATRGSVPRVVGQVFLFGKQTDRAARIELVVYRSEKDAAQAVLQQVAGASISQPGEEQVSSSVGATQHALSWNWRLPEDTPDDLRHALLSEERNDVLMNKWPAMKQKIFGGHSPAEVASDAGYRVKLLAAILLLETSNDQLVSDFDFNELRSALGLPTFGPIDPASVNVMELPLVRLERLEVGKLTDEQLLAAFQRADHYRHVAALRKLAFEIVARPSLGDQVDRAEVFGILAHTEPEPDKAIAHLDQARAAAEKAGTSTAPWDLAELTLRIATGDVPAADRLLKHIRDDHMREPGIAQALFQVLSDAGIIRPDGSMASAPPAAAPGLVVPGAGGSAAAAETSKLWTPGSDQGAAGKKSAIWTPGDM